MNGQRCTAGSRLLVAAAALRADRRATSPRARATSASAIRSTRATELGPLIRPEHHARVLELHRVGARARARACSPAASRPAGCPSGNFLEATVIADVDETMRVFQEEIFGPVLVATPFDDEAEAIRLANATQYGLAAYVWTNDIRRAHRVAQAIDTGMCWINSQNVRDLRTPFGGVKSSRHRPRGRRLRVRVLLRHRDRPRRARHASHPAARAAATRSRRDERCAIDRSSLAAAPRADAVRHHARRLRRARSSPTSTPPSTSTSTCSAWSSASAPTTRSTCAAGRSARTTRSCCARAPVAGVRAARRSACAPSRPRRARRRVRAPRLRRRA